MDARVAEEIKKKNNWYIGKHFSWAENPYVKNIYNGRFKFLSNELIAFCKSKKSDVNLVDIGCGDGYWLHRIQDLQIPNLKLTGVDYNELRIGRASEILGSKVELISAEINTIDLDKYDIILFNHVIEHIEDDIGVLKKLAGSMDNSKLLLLGTPNEGNFLMQRRNRIHNIFASTDHVHFYTESEIRKKIKHVGFTIDRTYRDPLFVGSDKYFYKILSSSFGFRTLKFFSLLLPQLCAGYIFSIRKK